MVLEKTKSAVLVVFYKPSITDLLNTLRNIMKFEIAILSWNSKPQDIYKLAENNNIDLSNCLIYHITNKSNLGVGGGINSGFKYLLMSDIKTKYVLVLDQDSFVKMNKNKISRYFNAFSSYKEFALLGFSRIKSHPNSHSNELDKDNSTNINSPTIGNLFNYSYMHSGVVYNLNAFIYLKGFRQEFFMEFTDIEYSLRAKRSRFALLHIDDDLIFHDAGKPYLTNFKIPNILQSVYHPLWIIYLQYRNVSFTLIKYIFYFPLYSIKSTIILFILKPIQLSFIHRSMLLLFFVIFSGLIDCILSLFMNKKMSLIAYNNLLSKYIKFKIPEIKKYRVK